VGQLILVLNCGSSSVKFALFPLTSSEPPRQALSRGEIGAIGTAQPYFEASGEARSAVALPAEGPFHAAIELIRAHVERRLWGDQIALIGHRVVHGGPKYHQPVRISKAVLADLRSYIPLAPLHQPYALDAIQNLLTLEPTIPQIACFDTGFHITLPEVETRMPLPQSCISDGLRRYGFHGLSYNYLSVVLRERYGERARGRTIGAHLGSGASLCAMSDGKSVATTMGFSALDGLVMGTRCGSLDPGAVLHLLENGERTVAQLSYLLYHEAGLLGLSGITSDLRILLERENEAPAALAIAVYVHRIIRELGGLAAVLGGLDLICFTAGVGENAAEIRWRVCASLAHLGVSLDKMANDANAAVISNAASRVLVTIEPANEEWIVAVAAQDLVRSG
jgi:acetate kinase